jgi:hypothetical protein
MTNLKLAETTSRLNARHAPKANVVFNKKTAIAATTLSKKSGFIGPTTPGYDRLAPALTVLPDICFELVQFLFFDRSGLQQVEE